MRIYSKLKMAMRTSKHQKKGLIAKIERKRALTGVSYEFHFLHINP